jgi:Zn-dependent protease
VAIAGYVAQQDIALPSASLPVGGGELSLWALLETLLVVNVSLALFNLIPIPPLDGFSVLLGLLPEGPAISLSRLYQYGPPLLLLLVFFGGSVLRVYFSWGWDVFDRLFQTPILGAFGFG